MEQPEDNEVTAGERVLDEAEAALRAHPRVHWSRGALGPSEPGRVVSLVPSLSEAFHVLGLGERLVGVTDYCVHPAGAFTDLARVGGTKDADVDAIARLAPDLVVANQEENTARVVRQLADRGLDVWVTYPRTVREGAELLDALSTLGASEQARRSFVVPCLEAVERAERAATARIGPRPRVFCPIWRDPWMSIAEGTYIHDLIELCGGRNLCAGAELSQGDRRYPLVDLDEVLAQEPDVILLPDEPYRFDESDAARFERAGAAASRHGRVHLIDGSLVSWYGPRIAKAIQVLADLLAAPGVARSADASGAGEE